MAGRPEVQDTGSDRLLLLDTHETSEFDQTTEHEGADAVPSFHCPHAILTPHFNIEIDSTDGELISLIGRRIGEIIS